MKKIFLHLGPGGNSDIDQHFLNDKNIEFYSHSLANSSEEEYIPRLITELEAFIKKENEKGEIHLVAHSFSAQILINLNQNTLKEISKVTFLAPTFNFSQQVFLFLNNIATKYQDDELANILPKNYIDLDTSTFWNVFALFSKKYPNYILDYFSKPENSKRFLEAAAQAKPLDENSFIIGSTELMTNYRDLSPINLPKETNVYIGKEDPYFNLNFISKLKTIFPQANFIEIENCGHYPHIEANLSF